MKVKEENGTLIVRCAPLRWGLVLAFVVLCLGWWWVGGGPRESWGAFIVWVGLVVVIGGLVVAVVKVSVYEFDSLRGVMRWRYWGLFGRRSGEVPFHEIRDVVVEEVSGPEVKSSYRVALLLANGEQWPLTLDFMAGRERVEGVRDRVLGYVRG
ncbi:MAG TPA: hypothetical protein VLL52_10025 [Anaerolineae bacterium]|nr:hypothetical protein [Anaerolineae bacterium]